MIATVNVGVAGRRQWAITGREQMQQIRYNGIGQEATVSASLSEVGRRPPSRGVLSFLGTTLRWNDWMRNHIRRREFITLLGGAATGARTRAISRCSFRQNSRWS